MQLTSSLVSALLLVVSALQASASPSIGCSRPANVSSGTYTATIDGVEREYIVRVPEGYNSSVAYPLVIAYHWFGGTAFNVTQDSSRYGNGSYYGLVDRANESAIFVAPQGIDNGWMNANDSDMAFTDVVVKTVDAELCVDSDQRFIVGFSFGGSMVNALANSGRGDTFRAAAVLSGTIFTPWTGEAAPIGFFVSHGVSDPGVNNPISMGRAMRDVFIEVNGCTNQTALEPVAGSETHVKTEYQNCSKPVTFVAFDGVHQYSPLDAGASTSWVPDEVWSFFFPTESS